MRKESRDNYYRNHFTDLKVSCDSHVIQKQTPIRQASSSLVTAGGLDIGTQCLSGHSPVRRYREVAVISELSRVHKRNGIIAYRKLELVVLRCILL